MNMWPRDIIRRSSSAEVVTLLTVRPGQHVRIAGDFSLSDAPRWGSGGFEVQQGASLDLKHVGLDAAEKEATTPPPLAMDSTRLSFKVTPTIVC